MAQNTVSTQMNTVKFAGTTRTIFWQQAATIRCIPICPKYSNLIYFHKCYKEIYFLYFQYRTTDIWSLYSASQQYIIKQHQLAMSQQRKLLLANHTIPKEFIECATIICCLSSCSWLVLALCCLKC
jgi:hypothetical protein